MTAMPAFDFDVAGVMETLTRRTASKPGSDRGGGETSASAFLATLIPVLIVSTIIFTVFLIFQRKLERVYGPRTYLPSLRGWQYSPKRSVGLFGWVKEYRELRDDYILGRSSIDNYLWIRFFKVLTVMCFVGVLMTWPILFPVNATAGGGKTQFDKISFSNVIPGVRYYAQALLAWVFLGFVMLLITRESRFYLRLRQLYFSSPFEHSRISTRTVMFTNVPEEARTEQHMRSAFPGVRSVWLVTVPTDLADHAAERDKAAAKLEAGENKLIKNHVKRQLKLEKKGQAPAAASPEAVEAGVPGGRIPINVDKKDRPQHRLPVAKVLPLGKKVDTIDWSRGELRRLIPQVAQEQQAFRTSKTLPQSACFVEFDNVQSATAAVVQLSKEKKAKMIAKQLGVVPDEVIWKNTTKTPAQTALFKTASTAFVWWLCIFWTIPVAVVGAISNINNIDHKVGFLRWIQKIPGPILGIVTGLVPVIALAVLMALVPIIMGVLAGLFEPTRGAQQLRVQSWYFPFQVIQVFLVTTFTSAAAATVTTIVSNPSQAPSLLAQNLPRASNFYISFFVLYGLNTTAMAFLQLVPLLFALVLGNILDSTPRKMYNRFTKLSGLGWGAIYPLYTNLGVIALAYSTIAPLVLGFAAVGFGLIYLAFRYNMLFVLGTTVSTNGASYARALQQLTVGIYLSEICLIGLFAIGIAQSRQSTGPMVLMIIFLVVTILWQIWLRRSLSKLATTLPEYEIAEKPFHEQGNRVDGTNGANDVSNVEMHPGFNRNNVATNGTNTVANDIEKSEVQRISAEASAPHPATEPYVKPTMMQRLKNFVNPEADAARIMRQLSPILREPTQAYTVTEHDEAYIHPAATSQTPTVWVARDKYGLSTQEIAGAREAVGAGERLDITDEYAWFNEKGKIEWDQDNLRKVPIFEEQPLY